MIRNEREYKEAVYQLDQGRAEADQYRAELADQGLSPDEIETVMGPLLSTQEQLAGEIDWYKTAQAGQVLPVRRIDRLGRLLIGMRIAGGITQRELAKKLGVRESVVSRDEQNEYRGVTIDRAQRVVDALGHSDDLVVAVGLPTWSSPHWSGTPTRLEKKQVSTMNFDGFELLSLAAPPPFLREDEQELEAERLVAAV